MTKTEVANARLYKFIVSPIMLAYLVMLSAGILGLFIKSISTPSLWVAFVFSSFMLAALWVIYVFAKKNKTLTSPFTWWSVFALKLAFMIGFILLFVIILSTFIYIIISLLGQLIADDKVFAAPPILRIFSAVRFSEQLMGLYIGVPALFVKLILALITGFIGYIAVVFFVPARIYIFNVGDALRDSVFFPNYSLKFAILNFSAVLLFLIFVIFNIVYPNYSVFSSVPAEVATVLNDYLLLGSGALDGIFYALTALCAIANGIVALMFRDIAKK